MQIRTPNIENDMETAQAREEQRRARAKMLEEALLEEARAGRKITNASLGQAQDGDKTGLLLGEAPNDRLSADLAAEMQRSRQRTGTP